MTTITATTTTTTITITGRASSREILVSDGRTVFPVRCSESIDWNAKPHPDRLQSLDWHVLQALDTENTITDRTDNGTHPTVGCRDIRISYHMITTIEACLPGSSKHSIMLDNPSSRRAAGQFSVRDPRAVEAEPSVVRLRIILR